MNQVALTFKLGSSNEVYSHCYCLHYKLKKWECQVLPAVFFANDMVMLVKDSRDHHILLEIVAEGMASLRLHF